MLLAYSPMKTENCDIALTSLTKYQHVKLSLAFLRCLQLFLMSGLVLSGLVLSGLVLSGPDPDPILERLFCRVLQKFQEKKQESLVEKHEF